MNCRNTPPTYDVLLTRTLSNTPIHLAELFDPKYDISRNTVVSNLTEIPAITLHNGVVNGLPAGLQLMSEKFRDTDPLGITATIEDLLAHVHETS